MASIATYLVTLHFVDEFTVAIAQALTVPESQRGPLWGAEVAGYKSVLEELVAEAEDFQAKHIRVHEAVDDGYYAALIDAMPNITGIGTTPALALINLRLELEKALDFHIGDDNELPQADA